MIDVMRIIKQHLTAKSLNGTLTDDYANGAIDAAAIISRLINDKNKDDAEMTLRNDEYLGSHNK